MQKLKPTVLARGQLALIHIYAHDAAISDEQRREIMREACGVTSSVMLDQAGFERAMAALERTLWERVDAGLAPDPRRCSVCQRPLIREGRDGRCPEGCQTRRVHAWSRTHWQSRCPASGMANSRELHMLFGLWFLLADSLPADKQAEPYLAAIIAKSATDGSAPSERIARLLDERSLIRRDRIRQSECLAAIEALKDRLSRYGKGPSHAR